MSRETEPFHAAVVHADGDTTVRLGGELDLASAAGLEACLRSLIDASAGTITLDLADVTFLDSTGLVTILSAQQRVVGAGRRLEVCNPSRSVRRVLALSGTSSLLAIEPPRLDAAAD